MFTLKQLSKKAHVRDQKICMGFVDVQRAVDSVSRKQIWQSLRERGIKTKLRNSIEAIHEVTRNYVRKGGEQSEEFVTKEET